jgi:serine/threonine-protein kinase
VGYTISGRLLVVVVASEAFVVYTFPLLYRRNLVEPLRSLLDGVKAIEGGSLEAHVDVSRPDEIGSLATSFNHMVDSLKETNDELRRQIAARSRDLADVLEEASPKSLHVGQTVDERYAITRVVGGGGMGIVYGAERVTDKRPLAIKIMSGSTTRDDAARFAREAEIAAQLHHPNLVSVLDVGVWEGRPYLVMELVEGGSLEDGRARFGDIPWAIPILGQIARGLAALHEGGIVHRDLKPANVLLGPTGAKITDFGIARQDDAAIGLAATVGVDAPTARASITRTGAIVGTLPYMAPELARGSKNASAASDVFALGLVAYEMLTGKLPFDLPPVMLGLAGKPLGPIPALPEDVPPELAARIMACLRTDPKDRPPAAELAQ